jgi:hypothetical protein
MRIVLHTVNPLDIPPEELFDLAGSLRNICPECDIEITSGDQRGSAVTLWEVLHLYLPWNDIIVGASSGASTAIIAAVVSFFKDRFKKEPKRTKFIAIFGPNGKIMKEVKLTNQEDEYWVDR